MIDMNILFSATGQIGGVMSLMSPWAVGVLPLATACADSDNPARPEENIES